MPHSLGGLSVDRSGFSGVESIAGSTGIPALTEHSTSKVCTYRPTCTCQLVSEPGQPVQYHHMPSTSTKQSLQDTNLFNYFTALALK